MNKKNEIEINGEIYVSKKSIPEMPQIKAEKFEDKDYVIIRAYSAGSFVGYLEKLDGDKVIMRKVRRLWYWDGANSLTDIALKGVTKSENCKFTAPIDKMTILGVIEIIECTQDAKDNIAGVKEWTKK